MQHAFAIALRRVLALLGCIVLWVLAFITGGVALVVPGIIFGVSLMFGPYLTLTDELGPVKAIKKSHQLVWGNWWHTVGIISVLEFLRGGPSPVTVGKVRPWAAIWQYLRAFGPGYQSDVFQWGDPLPAVVDHVRLAAFYWSGLVR